MPQETPSQAPESVLKSIATSVAQLRKPIRPGPDRYTPAQYYLTTTGSQVYDLLGRIPELIRDPRAVDRLNAQIKPTAELTAKMLAGIESPREQLQGEMRVVAEKVSRLIPPASTEHIRRQAQKDLGAAQVDRFGEGMALVLEEVINGTDQIGNKTSMTVLSRIAQYEIGQLPQETKNMLFVKGADGRLHFNKGELPAVTNLRKKGAVIRGANLVTGGLFKDGEAPVSVHRGVKAVAGRLGRGLLGAYVQMNGADQAVVSKAKTASSWLYQRADAFDPKLRKGLNWGGKFNGMVQRTQDVLEFAEYELPLKLSQGIDAIPSRQHLAKIGALLRGAYGVGVTGVAPLLDLPFFKAAPVKK